MRKRLDIDSLLRSIPEVRKVNIALNRISYSGLLFEDKLWDYYHYDYYDSEDRNNDSSNYIEFIDKLFDNFIHENMEYGIRFNVYFSTALHMTTNVAHVKILPKFIKEFRTDNPVIHPVAEIVQLATDSILPDVTKFVDKQHKRYENSLPEGVNLTAAMGVYPITEITSKISTSVASLVILSLFARWALKKLHDIETKSDDEYCIDDIHDILLYCQSKASSYCRYGFKLSFPPKVFVSISTAIISRTVKDDTDLFETIIVDSNNDLSTGGSLDFTLPDKGEGYANPIKKVIHNGTDIISAKYVNDDDDIRELMNITDVGNF